jgi:hypothetical protein
MISKWTSNFFHPEIEINQSGSIRGYIFIDPVQMIHWGMINRCCPIALRSTSSFFISSKIWKPVYGNIQSFSVLPVMAE